MEPSSNAMPRRGRRYLFALLAVLGAVAALLPLVLDRDPSPSAASPAAASSSDGDAASAESTPATSTPDTGVGAALSAATPEVPAPVAGDGGLDDEGLDQLAARAAVEPVKVIVGLDAAAGEGSVDAARQALLAELGDTSHAVVRTFDSVPYVALEVAPDAVERLRSTGAVASIAEDLPLEPYLAQSGPLVQAPEAWARGADGEGGVVAVIDTGVERTHPFLAGKVVDEACFLAGGTCPGGRTTATGPGAAAPCTQTNCFHGTHVAGIAAGAGSSFSGVAKGAGIMAVRVFDSGGPAGVQANTSDLIAALEHVYAKHTTVPVRAVNISFGGGLYTGPCDGASPALDAVVRNLRQVGIATVAAAGNGSSPAGIGFPACVSSVVSVGATDKSDVVAGTSNRAPFLTLMAPGVSINSSKLQGTYGAVSGTSMAAPHVAGAVAALRDAVPDATVDALVAALRDGGAPVAADGRTYPRLRVRAALDLLSPPAPVTTPVLRGVPVVGGASGSSMSVGLPAGVVAGDLLLASVSGDAGTSVATPAGWSLLPGFPYQNGSESYRARQWVFWRVADGSESGVTFAKSASRSTAVVVTAVSGVDPVNPFDGWAVKVATWSTVPSPEVTTSVDGALVLGLVSARNQSGGAAPSVTPPSWLAEQAERASGAVVGEVASVLQPAAGPIGAKWFNTSSSAGIVATLLALRPRV